MSCLKAATGFAFFLQFAAAIAFLVIIVMKLDHYTFTVNGPSVNGTTINLPSLEASSYCLLGYTSAGGSLCVGSYIVAGISLAASFALSLFLCLTCNLCGLGAVIDAVFAGVACALWSVWSSVLIKNEHPNAPMQDWRTAVIALAIACAALFGIACLFSLSKIFASCCSCCGCGSGSSGRDVEQGKQSYKLQSSPQQQFMYGGPAPAHPPPVVVVPQNSRW